MFFAQLLSLCVCVCGNFMSSATEYLKAKFNVTINYKLDILSAMVIFVEKGITTQSSDLGRINLHSNLH